MEKYIKLLNNKYKHIKSLKSGVLGISFVSLILICYIIKIFKSTLIIYVKDFTPSRHSKPFSGIDKTLKICLLCSSQVLEEFRGPALWYNELNYCFQCQHSMSTCPSPSCSTSLQLPGKAEENGPSVSPLWEDVGFWAH